MRSTWWIRIKILTYCFNRDTQIIYVLKMVLRYTKYYSNWEHIGAIIDDRLKEKVLNTFRVCLSVCVCPRATGHTFCPMNLIFGRLTYHFMLFFTTITMEISKFHFRNFMIPGGYFFDHFLWNLWKGSGDYWYNHGMWYINLVCFFSTKTMGIIKIHFGQCVGRYGPGPWY